MLLSRNSENSQFGIGVVGRYLAQSMLASSILVVAVDTVLNVANSTPCECPVYVTVVIWEGYCGSFYWNSARQ